jgi:YVTN family beta-propeller protein
MKSSLAVTALVIVASLWVNAHAAFSTATITTGVSPSAIAVNPLTNKIYVMNESDKTVTVINGANNQTTLVPLTGLHKRAVVAGLAKATGQTSPPHGIAINAVTNRVYLANFGASNVVVLDGATDTPIATVPAGNNPSGIAVNVATNKIYVANYGNLNGTTVTVIDGADNHTTTLTVGTGPKDIAVNPVTNKIYVTNEFSYFLSVIDGPTNQVTSVPTTDQTFFVVVNPVTNKVFVSGYYYFTMLDGSTNATDITFKIWFYPRTLGVNVTTNMVYVNNADGQGVTIFNAATKLSTGWIATGAHPVAVGINPVTNKVFVPCQTTAGEIAIYDGNTNTASGANAGSYATGIAVNPITNKVYITNNWASSVTVLSESSAPNPTFATTFDPAPAGVTTLARPSLSGSAVNRLRPAHAALWEIRNSSSTSPFASWSAASIAGGAGTDSVEWNWAWGTDSLLPGENYVWATALDSAAVSASLPPGTPFGVNVAVAAVYRVDSGAMTRVPPTDRAGSPRLATGCSGFRCFDVAGRLAPTLASPASGVRVIVARVNSGVYRQSLLLMR